MKLIFFKLLDQIDYYTKYLLESSNKLVNKYKIVYKLFLPVDLVVG